MTWQTKGMKIKGLSEDKGVKERTGRAQKIGYKMGKCKEKGLRKSL